MAQVVVAELQTAFEDLQHHQTYSLMMCIANLQLNTRLGYSRLSQPPLEGLSMSPCGLPKPHLLLLVRCCFSCMDATARCVSWSGWVRPERQRHQATASSTKSGV